MHRILIIIPSPYHSGFWVSLINPLTIFQKNGIPNKHLDTAMIDKVTLYFSFCLINLIGCLDAMTTTAGKDATRRCMTY